MSDNVALVVGARGVIGGNLVQHLASLDSWQVVGLSVVVATQPGPSAM